MALARRIDMWLRCGWAMDFFLGEVTRDHADIDWFAWARDAAVNRSALVGAGWRQVGKVPVEQQLDVIPKGHEMSIGWLARDEADQVVVAGGPWAQEPWPAGMLDDAPGRIGQVFKDAQDVARLTSAPRDPRNGARERLREAIDRTWQRRRPHVGTRIHLLLLRSLPDVRSAPERDSTRAPGCGATTRSDRQSNRLSAG